MTGLNNIIQRTATTGSFSHIHPNIKIYVINRPNLNKSFIFYCITQIKVVFTKSSIQKLIIYIKQFRPLGNTFRFAVVLKEDISRFISSLHRVSSPSTVFFAVVPVVIYSVNRSLFFSKIFNVNKVRFAHVSSKFFKRIPLTLHTLAPPSVVIRVASFLNSRIGAIESRYPGFWSLSVLCPHSDTSLRGHFLLKTAARFSSTIPQIYTRYVCSLTTVTHAIEHNPPRCWVPSVFFNNTKFVEFFVSTVYFVSHSTKIAIRSGVQRLLPPARTSDYGLYSIKRSTLLSNNVIITSKHGL